MSGNRGKIWNSSWCKKCDFLGMSTFNVAMLELRNQKCYKIREMKDHGFVTIKLEIFLFVFRSSVRAELFGFILHSELSAVTLYLQKYSSARLLSRSKPLGKLFCPTKLEHYDVIFFNEKAVLAK